MKTLGIILVASALAFTAMSFSGEVFSKSNDAVIQESFQVGEGGVLKIDTDSGAIQVVSHNSDTVDVRVERKGKSRDSMTISFDRDGNDVIVKGDKKGVGVFNWGRSGVKFIVKVPNRYNVDLDTSGGSITIAALIGKVEAYTSGGSIKLGKIVGDVNVKTSGGSIKVDDVAGAINAKTSGGSIRISMSRQPEHDSKLSTSGGSVTAYLKSDIAVDLSASTSGGRVSSDFNVDGSVRKTSIDGEINGGGPKLVLRTSGGSVRVEKL